MPNTDKELTVEECLAELREMFPNRVIDVLRQYGVYQTLAQDSPQVYDFWRVVVYDRMATTRTAGIVGNIKVEAPTLREAMNQVRRWKESQQ